MASMLAWLHVLVTSKSVSISTWLASQVSDPIVCRMGFCWASLSGTPAKRMTAVELSGPT